jgi:hypothetical protein
MKLIMDNKNNIICRTNIINNEDILSIIKKDVLTIWDKKPSKWIDKDFKNQLEEIEMHEGFSIHLRENEIEIYGDNGLIILEIIEIDSIKEL